MKKIIILILISVVNLAAQDYSYRHRTGIALGAASGTHAGGETAFVIGVDYEYMINNLPPRVGVGFYFDAALFENSELLFGIPFSIFPYQGIKILLAPSFAYNSGWEDTRTYGGDGFLVMEPFEEQFRFFMRYGAGYELVFQNYSVTPALYGDVISSNLYVTFGIDFAITFK